MRRGEDRRRGAHTGDGVVRAGGGELEATKDAEEIRHGLFRTVGSHETSRRAIRKSRDSFDTVSAAEKLSLKEG